MVSLPKSKGHTRYMAERPQYTNDFGCAAALRLPVKEFLVGTGGLERNTAAETYSISNPKRSFFGNQCLDLARNVGCGGSVTGKKGSGFLEVDAVANTFLVSKGTYGMSSLTAKGGSELFDVAKEDCTLGLLNINAGELPRTLDVTRAGATSPTGQDTMQEVIDEEDSKEAALSMTELDQARMEMVASAADRKAKTRGEHLHFFDRVQIRGVAAEAGGERPSNPESMFLEPGAPTSELDAVLTSHSDNGGECKLGTVKSDIRKPCLYKTMGIPLDSNLLQRHEQNVFPENGNIKLGLESPLEASTFVPSYTTPIQPSGLLDKLSNNLSIRGFEFGHFSDHENSSAIESSVLKNLCSKRKASLNVEDAHLQRKYGMNEKNERITPFQDSNECKLGNFFHLDVNNAEDGRNWTMALKSSYQDTKVRGLNSAFQYKGKLIKSNYEKKKQVSITGTTKKLGSSNVNGICSEAIVDLGSNRHVQRSFMRWVLSAGKCLGRTQQGFVEDIDSSSGLRKTPRVEELKCMADYLDVAEKHQETTVRISQQGEASTEFFGKDSSIDLAVKSSCPGTYCCNNSGNQSTFQHSGDRKPVDCKQELSITRIKDQNTLAEKLVDVSSNVCIPSNRLTTSMEEQRERSCNLPVLGERLCNAEDNLQPLQDEAKTDEKILERSSNSVARNRLHHHLSPAMVHKASSFLKKNALHNAGALKGSKVGDMWVEGYLVRSKLASPNSQIRTSADSPIRNHFLEAEGIDQNIHLETYSESYHSFHAHDAMKSEITDIRQESAYKIDAELNKRPGEIAPLHLDAVPGIRFPAYGSGDLPSPREIAEFAAAMKTVKTWINQTSSQEKATSEWHSQIPGHVQVCEFCGCQGHTLYKCSETLDPELQELGRRACLWEEKAAEVGKVWCLRCLGSGHWGAQCYQPMNVTAVHGQELNMFKEQNKKNCQSRDKLPSARHFSFLESLTNVQRTLQLPSLPTNASEHHDPAHLSFSGQSETKSQNRKSNMGQNCPAMPGPSKLADYAILPLMSNQGCANMQRTKEPIIEVKGEKETSKHMEIMAKKDGESTDLQKSKKRAKVDRQSHKVAQDSKTITKKQFKEEACPEDASKKGANSFPALLQGTKKNWPEEFLRSIPRKILSCIESTRLSRSDIWKYAGCLDFSVRMHGFFLRLRFGHWDEELGGTGYRMGRIKGAATKNLVGKRKIAVSVDLGDIECIVDAKFVSNQAFSQLELFNWWCGMRLKSKSVPKDDELRGLFEQRCQWELE